MDVTVVVSRVVDPGPPAVVRQKAVNVDVPTGVNPSDVAAALRRTQRETGTSVDVLL